MNTSLPRYLLFSEARRLERPHDDSERPSIDFADFRPPQGEWRFVLESLDDGSVLDVTDEEETDLEERLELLAVVRGLEALEQPSRVTLVTASQYVDRGLRSAIEAWREDDRQGERFERWPIQNGDLWKRVDRALQFHQVECRTWRFESPASSAITSPSDATARRRRSRARRAAAFEMPPESAPSQELSPEWASERLPEETWRGWLAHWTARPGRLLGRSLDVLRGGERPEPQLIRFSDNREG